MCVKPLEFCARLDINSAWTNWCLSRLFDLGIAIRRRCLIVLNLHGGACGSYPFHQLLVAQSCDIHFSKGYFWAGSWLEDKVILTYLHLNTYSKIKCQFTESFCMGKASY